MKRVEQSPSVSQMSRVPMPLRLTATRQPIGRKLWSKQTGGVGNSQRSGAFPRAIEPDQLPAGSGSRSRVNQTGTGDREGTSLSCAADAHGLSRSDGVAGELASGGIESSGQ